MDSSLKEILWKQFGASIDMFENSIKACPDELWNSDSKFWYIGYHTFILSGLSPMILIISSLLNLFTFI